MNVLQLKRVLSLSEFKTVQAGGSSHFKKAPVTCRIDGGLYWTDYTILATGYETIISDKNMTNIDSADRSK